MIRAGVGRGQAVRSTRVREPDGGASAPGCTWARGRRLADPAASQHREQPALALPGLHGASPPPRPARRPLASSPAGGSALQADSWGRWRRSRDAPGSAPPPHSNTLSPTSAGYRTARGDGGGGHSRVTVAGGLASPAPPGSPASNARRETPPQPRPFALGLGWWSAPPHSPCVPAHCPAGSASPQAPSGPARSG
nr:nascent polypeptide-associated complex subunit alpha, muscle-specific form-like [Ovis aries]